MHALCSSLASTEQKNRAHHYKAIPEDCAVREARETKRESTRVSHCCSTNKYAQCFIVARSIVRVKFMYRLCIHEVCEHVLLFSQPFCYIICFVLLLLLSPYCLVCMRATCAFLSYF